MRDSQSVGQGPKGGRGADSGGGGSPCFPQGEKIILVIVLIIVIVSHYGVGVLIRMHDCISGSQRGKG